MKNSVYIWKNTHNYFTIRLARNGWNILKKIVLWPQRKKKWILMKTFLVIYAEDVATEIGFGNWVEFQRIEDGSKDTYYRRKLWSKENHSGGPGEPSWVESEKRWSCRVNRSEGGGKKHLADVFRLNLT